MTTSPARGTGPGERAYSSSSLQACSDVLLHPSRVSVADRLHSIGLEYEKRKDELRTLYHHSELEAVTATPKINETSRAMHNPVPVQERLLEFMKLRNDRLAKARAESSKKDPSATFTPQITLAAKKLTQRTADTVPGLLFELAKENERKREEERKKQEQSQLASIRKGPQLNERSLKIVEKKGRSRASHSIADLLCDADRQRRQSTVERLAMLSLMENPGP